jgi:hypothetical protein
LIIIFWNLRANTLDFPTIDQEHVALVSGFNQNILKSSLSLILDGNMTVINNALKNERYDRIK